MSVRLARHLLLLAALGAALSASACNSCIAQIEPYTGTSTTAEGVLRRFLEARKEGHSGDEFWRAPVDGFPKVSGAPPINPTTWESVLRRTDDDDRWVWHRFRVKSTTPVGIPIEKLWDFCFNKTVEGYRLVAVSDASDDTVRECTASIHWVKFQFPSPEVPFKYTPSPLPPKRPVEPRPVVPVDPASASRFKVRSVALFGEEKEPSSNCNAACGGVGTPRDCDLCICLVHKVSATECDKRANR